MPFERPSLPRIVERVQADIESRLPGSDPRLSASNLGVLSRVLAGSVHHLYGFLDFLSRQVLPDTAESEFLERWASLWGLKRKAPAFAGGEVAFTGTPAAVVPEGAVLVRADGAEYETLDEATLSPQGAAVVPVRALAGGAGGNAAAGSRLALAVSYAGVDTAAVAWDVGLTGGTDEEGDEALRARLAARLRQPPHGGADFDYVAWALEVPGVTRAFVFPLIDGPGSVGVAFVNDDAPSPIPNQALVEQVAAHIASKRPVTAVPIVVFAPAAEPVNFTLSVTPDTPEVRAAAEAELADLLRREGAPGQALLLSHVREAISAAVGEFDHNLLAPAANVPFGPGRMPVMGTVTWNP